MPMKKERLYRAKLRFQRAVCSLVLTCLIGNRDRDMRELECLQELNRTEYQHVYPVSD